MSLSNLFSYFTLVILFCIETRLLFKIWQQRIDPVLIEYIGFPLVATFMTGIAIRVIFLAALMVIATIQMK